MWRVANGLDNAALDFIFCWWNLMAFFSRALSIFTQKLVRQDTSCKMFLKQISFTKFYVSEVKTIWIEKSEMQKTKENVTRASCGFFLQMTSQLFTFLMTHCCFFVRPCERQNFLNFLFSRVSELFGIFLAISVFF